MPKIYGELLTVARTAEATGWGQSTIRKWIADGELAVVVLPSGQIRIRRADIDRIMQPRLRPRRSPDPSAPASVVPA